jgi:iron complex outermembrane recepter protein
MRKKGNRGMMRQLLASAAAVALLAAGGTGSAFAQDAGGTGGAGQAPAPTPPQTQQQPSQQLPQVQVIQEQPKPKPVKKASKPKPKPPTAAAAVAPALESPEATEATTAGVQYAEPPETNTVKMSPIGGSIPVDKVPGSVYQMNASDLKRGDQAIIQDALVSQTPGLIIDDLQGNQFQTNIQFRGFEASPVNGVAQGLAVYQNGVRINESFGDIVNWDFLPSNAINNVAVMVGNPVFGLNALGGALVVDMKDGFNYQGWDVDTMFGSFGRKQVSTEAGYRSGNWGVYGAFEAIDDDGFRDFSDAEVRRGYFDVGVKGDNAEFHFNFTGADNNVGVTAAAPEALLEINRGLTFTSPQTTENTMQMYSVNGKVRATDTLTFSGVTYYRHFNQKHLDGNLFDDPGDCGDGTLCSGDDQVKNAKNGDTIPFDSSVVYGSIDGTSQNADSAGFTVQGEEKSKVFGHTNQFVAGISYDHGRVSYTADSQLGVFAPKFVVDGQGIILTGSEDFNPRALATTNDYFGAFFTNTFDITDALSLTVGGRYNQARIQIEDTGGNNPELDGVNKYFRFNPSAGLTYKFSPALNWYGGYSEANRAPTAAELACADPENPCLIESFLTADPHLKQVVSHTWETGFRGTVKNWQDRSQWDWGVGLFRTLNTDDIFDAASTDVGHGFFQNIGKTLRQGVEANISYRSQRLFAYANYTYTDATFDSSAIFPSPNNPKDGTAACGGAGGGDDDDDDDEDVKCFAVHKGDRLPGVPAHTFKAGFDYWLTPKWKAGTDLVAASDQFFFGDEANLNRTLAGYAKVNLHTSYDITDHVQIYGLFENLFDKDYATYGTYYSTDDTSGPNSPASVAKVNLGENPRTVTPAIPFAAYGGVKVKF